MARKRKAPAADVGFNMTPMIDCTFQLIIFFILASQVANDAYAKNVQIVRPDDSQALPASVAEFPNRVTINVVSAAAESDSQDPMLAANAGFYKINTVTFEVGEWDRMIEVIKSRKNEFLRTIGMTEEQAAQAEAEAARTGAEHSPATFWLEIRADERVNYADIAPVIRAGVEAGISKMNITALTALVD